MKYKLIIFLINTLSIKNQFRILYYIASKEMCKRNLTEMTAKIEFEGSDSKFLCAFKLLKNK